ncbi:hypothetical protein RDWZM_005739 [Blomia tropicalis]|uniref:Fatty acyl-CoA reductase n=1 Tax=Blomia tropicalis TaxID=40697 RepID=A0A9Q0M8C3_BLOTA|nr:hypothetical protein BLOT_006410 [Blomia tropicalis]KAJ6219927.1 hypothetical protein RDWZM_005739 [Blomia tropicalis]
MATSEHHSTSFSKVIDFYRGQTIFITGATGFIGKVLLEKLLRTCPEIERIYVLMRSNRDGTISPSQRLADLLASKAFTFSEKTLPLKKVTHVTGDMTAPGLGLSQSDRQLLRDQVSVIFHVAATVKFHGPLNKFVKQNVLGTESIMKLALEMKRLQSVIYVSTAYANCNLLEIEEKVYPLSTGTAQQMIDQIMEENSDQTPLEGDPKLLGRPNSYTLSKSIAENLIREKYWNKLPVLICRPSIVTHSYCEPTPGWCDNINNLAGVLLLGYVGITRTMECNCDYQADIIPVDFVANSLIVSGWYAAQQYQAYNNCSSTTRMEVVHISSGIHNPITWGQITDLCRDYALKKPTTKQIRPMAKNPINARNPLGKINHLLVKFFSQLLFAYIFDFILLITRKERFMVKVTHKMHIAHDVIQHFSKRQWIFRADNYRHILNQLETNDRKLFLSDILRINWPDYCDNVVTGMRRYMLNEDDSTIEAAKKRSLLLNIIYGTIEGILYLTVFGMLLFIVHSQIV